MIRVSVFRLILIVMAIAASANARGEDASIDSVQIGFDGTARVGAWTPITVQASGVPDGATLTIVTNDPQGHPVAVSRSLSAGTATVHCQLGRTETYLQAQITLDDQLIASQRVSTDLDENGERDFRVQRHRTPRWILAGKMPVVDEATGSDGVLSEVHVTRLATSDFPNDETSLSGYDTVLLSGDFDLTSQQAQALNSWVKTGGHLICFLGAADRIEAFQNSRISGWVQTEVQSRQVSDLGGVEGYVQTGYDAVESDRIPIGARRVPVATVTVPGGISLDRSGISGSVLTRTALGFGRLTFAGIDMDRRPLSVWGDRGSGQFLLKLADARTEKETSTRTSTRVSHSGVTDLATQFREALESIPGVGDRSTLFVLGLMLFYLLIIGPVDYLLVHRVLKKPRLTWITFPAMVVVGALVARSFAQASNGMYLFVNQVDIVDIDVESGFVRETAFSSIYSPQHARYDVTSQSTGKLFGQNAEKPQSVTLSWFGMPEENYGGMYRAGGVELGKPGYTLSKDGAGLEGIPVPVWSNRSLRTETLTSLPEGLFKASLAESNTGSQLSRESTMSHNLPCPIEDWLIVYGNRAYFPKDLTSEHSGIRPGEVWTPRDSAVTSRDIAGYLTGVVVQRVRDKSPTNEKIVSATTAYDSQNKDIGSIVTMLSLHRLSGGHSYTGLHNFALRELEFSNHLPLNRALLIGRVSAPTTAFQITGKPSGNALKEAFVRILLPVKASKRTTSLPNLNDN